MELVGLATRGRAREGARRARHARDRARAEARRGEDRRAPRAARARRACSCAAGARSRTSAARRAAPRCTATSRSTSPTRSPPAGCSAHGLDTITAAHDLDRDQLLALLAAAPRGRVAVTSTTTSRRSTPSTASTRTCCRRAATTDLRPAVRAARGRAARSRRPRPSGHRRRRLPQHGVQRAGAERGGARARAARARRAPVPARARARDRRRGARGSTPPTRSSSPATIAPAEVVRARRGARAVRRHARHDADADRPALTAIAIPRQPCQDPRRRARADDLGTLVGSPARHAAGNLERERARTCGRYPGLASGCSRARHAEARRPRLAPARRRAPAARSRRRACAEATTHADAIVVTPAAPVIGRRRRDPPGAAGAAGAAAPVAAAARTAPQNEDWSNVSHINGQPVPVGDRNDYLYKFKKTNISVEPVRPVLRLLRRRGEPRGSTRTSRSASRDRLGLEQRRAHRLPGRGERCRSTSAARSRARSSSPA